MTKYTIGSFNIRKFNYETNKSQGKGKDFRMLADIIDNEGFDVIAIQEAFSPSALNHLVDEFLGRLNWDCVWEESDNHDKYTEGYGFIWNKKRLRLVNTTQHENPRVIQSVNYSKSLRLRGCEKLIRPPYVAEFTPQGKLLGGPNFQFRLINTHIAWEKPNYIKGDLSDLDVRKNELAVLSEEIYRRISRTRGGMLVPYTFLMGDYNLCLVGSHSKIKAIIPIEEGRNLKTVQTERTTLKRPQSIERESGDEGEDVILEEGSIQYYANNYDHFSYEEALDDKMTIAVSRVDTLSTQCKNDTRLHWNKISDHVPIKMEITLR